jgi:hypothetical protein
VMLVSTLRHRLSWRMMISGQGHISWISDTLLRVIQNVPPSLTIDVRICITGIRKGGGEGRLEGDVEVEVKGSSESHNTNSDLLNSPAVLVQYRRPDLGLLVKDEITHASGDIFIGGTYPYASSE